jgi:DNA-binding GntR family transcriptional regulator
MNGETNSFEEIERTDPLAKSVLQQITEAIVSGRLRPGDKLVEAHLARQLGVSRGPVREAIRRLEQMGLAEKIPYRGAFVPRLTQRDIEELHSMRELLEGFAARLLAERCDPQAVSKLQAILDEMRQVAIFGEQRRIITLDIGFHGALIELSEHKLLGEVWAIVSGRLRRFLVLKRQRLYSTLEEAVELHEPIVEAIAAGDAERAEAEAQHHVCEAAQLLENWETLAPGASEGEEVTV